MWVEQIYCEPEIISERQFGSLCGLLRFSLALRLGTWIVSTSKNGLRSISIVANDLKYLLNIVETLSIIAHSRVVRPRLWHPRSYFHNFNTSWANPIFVNDAIERSVLCVKFVYATMHTRLILHFWLVLQLLLMNERVWIVILRRLPRLETIHKWNRKICLIL